MFHPAAGDFRRPITGLEQKRDARLPNRGMADRVCWVLRPKLHVLIGGQTIQPLAVDRRDTFAPPRELSRDLESPRDAFARTRRGSIRANTGRRSRKGSYGTYER